MMYSAYKFNKQGDNIQFDVSCPNEPVHCSMFYSNWFSLTCIQISQEASKVVWYFHLWKNFPQFVVIHTVKGFDVVNKAEVNVFWNLLAFSVVQQMFAIWSLVPLTSLNPVWMSASSQFMYSWSLAWRIWALLYSMWDVCNCAVVWTFFGIAFLWDWNENWHFPVWWPLLNFPNLLAYWVQHTASSFRIWNSSTGIPSPPLALLVVVVPKAHWLCIPGCLALG